MTAAGDFFPVFSPEWWSVFTTSPGFVGLLALVPAIFALWERDRRIRFKERAAERARGAELEDRNHAAWWAQLQLARELIPELEPGQALELLEALAESAPDRTAITFVGVVLKNYLRPDDEEI